MKFLNFMEKKIDPFLQIKLSDLAQTISRNNELEVEFEFHSYFKPKQNIVTVSHYWNDIIDPRQEDGLKTDIYLRALGNVKYSDFSSISSFVKGLNNADFPSFTKQLFCLLEDQRLQRLIMEERPGTVHAFESRRFFLQRRYRERFTIHLTKNELLDAIFCAFYLQLTGKPVALPAEFTQLKMGIRQVQSQLASATSSADIIQFVSMFTKQLPKEMSDMKASYLSLSEDIHNLSHLNLNEGSEIDGCELKEVENKEEKDRFDEQLPTWHEEKEEVGDNFLEFDLDQGTKTDLAGESSRKEESGDQAFSNVQGESKESDGTNYDGKESTSKSPTTGSNDTGKWTGDQNKTAREIRITPKKPTMEQRDTYKLIKERIQQTQRSLQRSIQKTIEQKKIDPRNDLHFGRLGKKLLKVVTEENPRLFYKKDASSKELDVTFSLLVDCSASMFDKMDETKEGIVLFHEALRTLNIAHSITGFWEDAFAANEKEQPNYFFDVIDYETALLPNNGASIMQLQPEEDNRDGFAIRRTAKSLITRPEKHKILLVFTDGEPSAFDYTDNGIADTHEAVLDVRKRGIDVIGVFLSSGETQEKEKETMQSIYGRQSLVIPSIEEIPAYITPLLKRLLFKYL